MTTTTAQPITGLLKALDGVRNRNAFISLMVGFIGAGLLTALSAYGAASSMSGFGAFMGALGMVLAVLFGLTLFSAAGIHISRQFRGQATMGFTTTLLAALATIPRFLGIFLLIVLCWLVIALALVVVFFICKLPGLGPILYFFALPVGAVIFGMFSFGLFFLTPLMGPAIWSGKTIIETLAILFGIFKSRLLTVIISSVLLSLLVFFCSMVIGGVIGFGLGSTSTISASILNTGEFEPMLLLMGSLGGMGGYMAAGAAGAGLLMLAATAVPFTILLAGQCLIYNDATQGLSVDDIHKQINDSLQNVKEQARQAKERLNESSKDLADKASETTAQVKKPRAKATKAAEPAAPVASSCPACQTAITADDVFCGNCGHRLK